VLYFTTVPTGLYGTMLLNSSAPYDPALVPLTHVSSSFPPTYICVAENDNDIPVEQSYKLQAKLESLGVEVQLAVAKGMRHGWFECLPFFPVWTKEQIPLWWDDVAKPSLDFVLRHLG